MNICLIGTHSFPIDPNKPPHTGDVVILDLAHGLRALGHDVTIAAPIGTAWDKVLSMPASFGEYPPSSDDCELVSLDIHRMELLTFDIVHDFSNTKRVSQRLASMGRKVCQTLMGGCWRDIVPPDNLIVWSQSHRDRVLRGATDYEGTDTPDLGGPPGFPVKEAHVVHGGVDTEFYCPSDYEKDDYFLWMNRWHPVKGYRQAIQLAKAIGIRLMLAGEHPGNELFDYQRDCAREAESLIVGHPNISIEWLPVEGHHERKRELYRRAKALVYPVQFQEPFGLSMAEAMACGTPVDVPDLGSCREVVGNPGRWRGPEVREDAVRRFDRKVMAKNYLAQYEQIIAGETW